MAQRGVSRIGLDRQGLANQVTLDLVAGFSRQERELLGGEACGEQVLAPGPGHSAEDRSLSVKLDDDAADGFVINTFSGDDVAACRDHVRQKLGLPKFERKEKKRKGKGTAAKPWSPIVARYVYR